MAYRKTEKVLSKRAATRNLLIACAIDIIAADGLEALTTRALAERAEIATGSIFLHFAGTKEVLVAVASELRARDTEAMHQAGATAQRPADILIAGISCLAYIVASKYRLMSAVGIMPAYRDPVQHELAKLIKPVARERAAILAAMAYGAIFETARLGVRSEQTLTLCLLRAIGVPAKLEDVPVF